MCDHVFGNDVFDQVERHCYCKWRVVVGYPSADVGKTSLDSLLADGLKQGLAKQVLALVFFGPLYIGTCRRSLYLLII